ncbi:maltase A3-like [Chrysoperla carnea]|uniref:maltase A3-like n=1 Tax=Chrysoperla carnea TaxID=189513 RepID=UPI001D0997BE|nr:maltase A3-like [Chrysoperla carnea]
MRLQITICLLLLGCLVFVTCNPIDKNEIPLTEKEWWQTAVFYQIYPRSFKDSDGDGSGDLKGIQSQLSHIKDLGVTAAWLSPIYTSPQVDGGYDIANFTDVDPLYGTLEDFDNLIAEAKKLGLKIVLDFVPNHSSDKHEWFKKSVKRIDPYTNYYVWADAKIVNGTRQPPNNWNSYFKFSAWEWNEERGQYYLHLFAIQQPDLNYRDPNLVKEMKDVLRFWMNRGVAGFRVDIISALGEDEALPDEPLSGNCSPDDYCYLNHIYTEDQPLNYDMVVQWRDVLKEHAAATDKVPRVIMTESYSEIDKTIKYFGNETHDGACFPFNFYIIMGISQSSNAQDLKNVVDNYFNKVPKGRTPNWVLGNHDQHRVADRVGVKRIDGLNMLTMTLPGVAVTYNGEEFGQEDGFVTWEETQDPQAINAGEENYLGATRDPERTPLQWDDSKNAGFSTAEKTWLPVSQKYKETNLKKQKAEKESHYKVYKDLVKLRQADALINGDFSSHVEGSNVLLILRKLNNSKLFLTAINFGDIHEEVDLSKIDKILAENLKIEVSSVGAAQTQGSIVSNGKLHLHPYESYVLSKN